MAWRHGFAEEFSFSTPITTGMGTTTLVAAPTKTGSKIRVQALTLTLTTVAAQTIDIEDTSGTVELLKLPVSAPVGVYPSDPGPLGVALTANEALKYVATAGVGCTISGFGWIQES